MLGETDRLFARRHGARRALLVGREQRAADAGRDQSTDELSDNETRNVIDGYAGKGGGEAPRDGDRGVGE